MANKIKLSVYLVNGNVYEYEVASQDKAREHSAAIVATGYRSCDNDDPTKAGTLTHWPPHAILKVVATGVGISTSYPDKPRGT